MAVNCTIRYNVVMGDSVCSLSSLYKSCIVILKDLSCCTHLFSNFKCLLLPWLPHSLPGWPPTTYSGKQWSRRSPCQHLPDTQPSVCARSIFLLPVWNSDPQQHFSSHPLSGTSFVLAAILFSLQTTLFKYKHGVGVAMIHISFENYLLQS